MTRSLLALVLSAALASAADPSIRMPALPAPPPAPMPGPDAVAKLTKDTLYVVDSDVEILLLASPQGLVKVVKETGPIKVRGKFADGSGQTETRTYSGKVVYFVEAAHSGQVELLVIPSMDESAVIRRTIDVDAGEGPRPPPGPTPPDPPTPPEPPKPSDAPIKADGFRVLMVFESGEALPPGQHSAVYGKEVRDYLERKCVVGPDGRTREYRIYDPDDDFTNVAKHWQDAMKRPRQSIPWLIVSDGKTGWEGPLPTTVEETMAILKKYGGE